MILKAVSNILRGATPVTDIVGDRIFAQFIPEGNEMPSLLYSIDEQDPVDDKHEPGDMDTGIVEIRLFIDTTTGDASYKSLTDLEQAVRDAMETAYNGGTFNGVLVQHIAGPVIRDLFLEEQVREQGVVGKSMEFFYGVTR